ncbi:MAG TPA: hypothetical protein VG294_18870 [Solirubrobacteraceae bacterium]|jgi:hypothetical protein|nr:hypothetical protein [Solirubrobacteraceae bacterium]
MKRVLVQYRVKPDRVVENEALVRAVYDELVTTRPAGIRYATFRLEDGVSFAHLSETDTSDGANPLSALAAFKRFQTAISERCDEQPIVTELQEIGSFRMFE